MSEHREEPPEIGLGSATGGDHPTAITERFETPEPITVAVDQGIGQLRIRASDRSDTTVAVQPRDETSDADRKAVAHTRVELAGGTLAVRTVRSWRRFSRGAEGLVDVTIEVPSGSHLTGATGLGDLDAEGRLGDCRFRTAMGSIRLAVAHSAHLRTSFGDVVLGSCLGHADVATSSGAIDVREIGGAGVIRNSNGETTIGLAAGDLRVKAANGDVTITCARRSLVVKTARGGIRVGEVVEGDVYLQSSAGNVEVGIRAGSAAWLDVKSSYGTVRSELTAGEPPADARVVTIRASTSFGDVVLWRVPASHADEKTTEEGERP